MANTVTKPAAENNTIGSANKNDKLSIILSCFELSLSIEEHSLRRYDLDQHSIN